MSIMKLIPKLALVAVIILIAIAVLFFSNRNSNSISIDRNRTAVVHQVQVLGRLETTSYTIEKIIEGESGGNFFQRLLTGDRILFIAHGEVIGGIDLTKITENDVRVSGEQVDITLPAPEIFFTNLDNQQSKVYDRSRGLLSQGNDQLETEVRQAAEEEIRSAACEADILAAANENGRKQISALLSALGFTTINITTQPGSC